MQNDMRDRLVDLIKECHKKENDIMFGENRPLEFDEWTGIYADHLIANGVIVPPCKVGDTVWVDDFMWGLIPCKVDRLYHCTCGENGGCTFEMSFTDDDIGKTVFLKVERVPTKEQAKQQDEQKLKEMGDK